jgi:hypothetical protein
LKDSWYERTIKRLDEPKTLPVLIVIAVLAITLPTIYGLYVVNRFTQNPFPDTGMDSFSVTANNTDWKVTFEGAENSSRHMPGSYTALTNVYIEVFKPDGALGLATKMVSEMAFGQSYSGVRFFDLGDIGHLDDGDYFTFDRSIYPSGTEVTVEGHGSGYSWSMSFGL